MGIYANREERDCQSGTLTCALLVQYHQHRSCITREPISYGLPALKWVAILHKNRVRDTPAQRDHVNGFTLGEALEHGELRPEHIDHLRRI